MSEVEEKRSMYAHGRDTVNGIFDTTTGGIELFAKTVSLGNMKLDGVIASEKFEQLKLSLTHAVDTAAYLEANQKDLFKYGLTDESGKLV